MLSLHRLTLALALPMLLVGCWEIDRTHTTLWFHLHKGSGSFQIEISDIACKNKQGKCTPREWKEEQTDIKAMTVSIKDHFSAAGLKNVSVQIKPKIKDSSMDALLRGEFNSLSALVLFRSIGASFFEKTDEPISQHKQRTDLQLEFTIEKEDLVAMGTTNGLTFHSTDPQALILSCSEGGKLSHDRRSVTWKNLPFTQNLSTIRLSLRGHPFRTPQ